VREQGLGNFKKQGVYWGKCDVLSPSAKPQDKL